eukprot:4531098-Amphidinium_carterae.1
MPPFLYGPRRPRHVRPSLCRAASSTRYRRCGADGFASLCRKCGALANHLCFGSQLLKQRHFGPN